MPQQRTGEAHGFCEQQTVGLAQAPDFCRPRAGGFRAALPLRQTLHAEAGRHALFQGRSRPQPVRGHFGYGEDEHFLAGRPQRDPEHHRAWGDFRRDRAARRTGPLDRRHRKQQLRTLRHRPARIHPLCESSTGAGDEIHRIALRAVAIDQRSGRADYPAESAGTAGQCAASPVRKARRLRRRAEPSRSRSRRSARWSA